MKKRPNLFIVFTVSLLWAAPVLAESAALHHFDLQLPAEIELGRSTDIEVKTLDQAGQVTRRTMDAIVDITNRNGIDTQKVAIKNGKGKISLLFNDASDQGAIIVKISNEDGSIFNTAGSRVRLPLKVMRGAR